MGFVHYGNNIIMTVINWTKIQKKYSGQWIALENDEKTVIASGKTPKEAREKAYKKGSSPNIK